MIIKGSCDNVSILYATSKQGVKDPSKNFYSLGLWFQDFNQTGEVPCSEDIYNAVSKVANDPDLSKKLGVVYDFDTAYNTDYHSFRLVSVRNNRKK